MVSTCTFLQIALSILLTKIGGFAAIFAPICMVLVVIVVTGLADIVVSLGNGYGPRAPPRCLEVFQKSFKWLI